MKKFKIPHPYVLIFILIVISTILTYVIPAGSYERYFNEELNRELLVQDSFNFTEKTPVNPFEMIEAIPKGMNEVAWIMVIVFIAGGTFHLLNETGAITAGINASINRLKKRDFLLISIIFLLFSFGGGTIALAESTIIFIPIGVMLAQALGYDAMVGMFIVNVGATIGFASGWMNVYTTGVAQGIAGLPLFSGMEFRLVCWAIFSVISLIYIFYYCKKLKTDPTKSLLYGSNTNFESYDQAPEMPELTKSRKIVLLIMLLGFIMIFVLAVMEKSSSIRVSAIYLIMGILAGIVCGMKSETIANHYIEGFKKVVYGAIIIGLCRAMVVILSQGNIIDTILYYVSNVLTGLPRTISSTLMVPVQSIINLIINSGSGQAATTMPIMAPLSDVLGFSRQTAVLAFQFGDGFSNSLWPTSGVLMAGLAIANINFEKWWSFIWKLMVALHIAGMILIMVSVAIGYQ